MICRRRPITEAEESKHKRRVYVYLTNSELLVLRILQDFELQATTALSLLEEADGRGWDLHRWWGKKDEQGRKAGKVEDRCTDRALNPLCGKQQVRCTRGAICKRQIQRRFFFRKSMSENNAEHYFK